jgi:hypothetical protein
MIQSEISKDTFPVEYYAINLMELDDKRLKMKKHRKPAIMIM